ncbi:hypothetical protein CGRA01v4_12918 [Colletotrichum graminicola]|uniref:NACHT-NTPase and P-loop NTPases N-terminal domain-containing protein n=1 Tax=Colletotrichum graminicola (strain M1.001 / M2 / FGSC 10212) TaxID=645133 RepID=E3QJ13_COLGM|nr:uncharacterized protein GLRG_05995 [Colletotrichum graminicola M1.001]EFQ30851.1 hypothetical protein GLRG_05995 [Colletotrichum graminicola M1.001]WDK21628.1 hypothetical protein CGRA01v4_12918 [Colletotrichum graminicola]
MASGFEIFGLIGTIITIIDTSIEVFGAIEDLRGLPEAFKEVNNRLPLIKEILEEAKGHAKDAPANEVKALGKTLASCQKKTKELQEIFLKIQMKAKDGEFVTSVYKALVLKLGKKSRVEDLMQNILQDFTV